MRHVLGYGYAVACGGPSSPDRRTVGAGGRCYPALVVATHSAGRANPTSSIGWPEAPPHAQREEGAAAIGTAAATSGGASAAGGAATAASLVNAAGGAAAEEVMAAEEAGAAAAAADDACGDGGSGGFDWESADVFSRVYFPKEEQRESEALLSHHFSVDVVLA